MDKPSSLTPLEAVNEIRNNNNGQVVLVLQGGGALGAYQGGVYQALHEAGVEPDWIIGTSIGAINAALITGNKPEDRLPKLKEFWKRVERANFWGAFPAWAGAGDALASWLTLTKGISGFFEPHTHAFLGAHIYLGADHAGYYSTEPLRKTLEELVDFSLLNQCSPRLTVGAAHVRTSMMHYFDSRDMDLALNHIMASGALPPAFPRRAYRGRALLGRWRSFQYSDRARLRGQSAPQRFDLCSASMAPNRRRAADHLAGPQPPQGHSIFEPHQQLHRAAARGP